MNDMGHLTPNTWVLLQGRHRAVDKEWKDVVPGSLHSGIPPPSTEPPFSLMTHRTASVIGAIGRTLIGFGLVVLAFAAFQLWGTSFQEARAQGSLETEFEERQALLAQLSSGDQLSQITGEADEAASDATNDDDPVLETESTEPTTEIVGFTREEVEVAPELAEALLPQEGNAMGSISIPSIGVERTVIEGINRDHLREGPGHYPDTPLPGQAGNSAIAGHRTTYGSPFHDLDKLEPGDEIFVETLQGTFRYEVMAQENPSGGADVGHFIVDPSQVEVLEDFGDNRLTLTACHPKYSAAQRIVVTAVLASEPVPIIRSIEPLPTATNDDSLVAGADEADDLGLEESPDELALDEGNVVGIEEDALIESLGWNFEERTPTIIWGAITALIVVIGLVAARLWRRWPAYILTAPFFLGALFVCFTHLDRLLPAL